MLRFGLLGGTFDPVHNGHVALARAAHRELRLHRLFLVPAARSPHKRRRTLLSDRQRLALLRRALGRKRSFVVSDWEIRRGGVSYTEKTLRAFRRKHPRAEWFLIMGGDAWRGFKTWRRWRWLLRHAHPVVGKRNGGGSAAAAGNRKAAVDNVIFLKTRLPRVSATDIRRRAAAAASLKGLVPPGVAAVLRKRRGRA